MTTKPKVICVQHRAGWCALAQGGELDPRAVRDATACGHVVMLRGGSDTRTPDCPDCLKALEDDAQ